MAEPFPGGITAPSDWIDGILPMLPNANVDWIKNEILIKLRTFFTISGAWRGWIGPINLDPTTAYYSPELTDYKAEMIAILGGYRTSDDQPLKLVKESDHTVAQMIRDEGRALPNYTFQTAEGLIAIFPIVPNDVVEQVMIFASMRPIDLCVPEFIKLKFFDAIRVGVLGAGYMMPGINYKPELGARYERRFRSLMSRATMEAIASGTALAQYPRIPRITRGSQRHGRASIAVTGTRW